MKAYLITYNTGISPANCGDGRTVVIAKTAKVALERFFSAWQWEFEHDRADFPPEDLITLKIETIKADEVIL